MPGGDGGDNALAVGEVGPQPQLEDRAPNHFFAGVAEELCAQSFFRLCAAGDVLAGSERAQRPALAVEERLPAFLDELDPTVRHAQPVLDRLGPRLTDAELKGLTLRLADELPLLPRAALKGTLRPPLALMATGLLHDVPALPLRSSETGETSFHATGPGGTGLFNSAHSG